MDILIEDSDGRPINVSIDFDVQLQCMLSELGAIAGNIFPDDPHRRAELRGAIDVAVAKALKAAAKAVLT